jgi:hypothetical protein
VFSLTPAKTPKELNVDAISYAELPHQSNSTIPATLHGDDVCRAVGLEVRSTSPIIGMCRELVERGYDQELELHAYRNEVLAVIVASIGRAVKLEVNGRGTGFRPVVTVGRASLVRWSEKNDPGNGGGS